MVSSVASAISDDYHLCRMSASAAGHAAARVLLHHTAQRSSDDGNGRLFLHGSTGAVLYQITEH